MEENHESEVQQFYGGRSIFMTGGTGFLGKIIMEKLLRTCRIDTIYLLIRDKKGKNIHTRVEELLDDVVYDRLRQQQPKFRYRVHPIAGDCSLPGLGISAQDRALLMANVHIVFHVAATVRFDEKLNIAMGINVNGTREVLTLCREIKNLVSAVHVSTAYANCNRPDIDERFYPHRLSAVKALQLYEALDESTLEGVGEKLSRGWPNTYTFTKALAEDLIKTEGKDLPIAIVRPAVVLPTAHEPVIGWIDNMYGPTGMVVGVGAGLIHVCHVHKDNNAELVPVDMCVNAILVSAWDRVTHQHPETPILNFVTTPGNKFRWRQYIDYAWKHGSQVPTMKSIWYTAFTVTDSKMWFAILWFFYHTIPAVCMDLCLRLVGKRPRMVDIYKKIKKYCDVIFFFTHMKFTFSNANTEALWSRLGERDREIFFFDMASLDWDTYMNSTVMGIRQYLMKESPDTIPAAKRRLNRFKLMHYTIVYTIYAIFGYLIVMLFAKILLPA
ncbi:fatty acyl-CoA reductase wat-like isoform X2 [Phlebotomus argentipes]|uniref:fatty acyl-CoA reductase wat-like isoform X2 n=1 Tax=Phlebotomus argentipes TaxID=94469 RepID=UPI0028936D5B|nr:fatty acyl-CoA reductase wat-like isoform X2 [Phlebotomus argentipes]